MSPVQYALSAASGALVFMGLDFYMMQAYGEMALAIVVFLLALWLIRLQPSNVTGGLIVQVDPLRVHDFVDGRDIQWCGNSYLHDMHVIGNEHWDTVCLGHECHSPEAHMTKKVTK